MKKIIPLIFSVLYVISSNGQAIGGWGTCEFATVATMNAFDPSTNAYDCKKVFVQATNEHYYWNGTLWVLVQDTDTDDQTLSLSSNTLSISEGNSVNLSSYLDNTDDQTAAEVTIADAGGNFTATNVEGALTELANATPENIYTSDGDLIDDRELTLDGHDLTIKGTSDVVFKSDGKIGLGINLPLSPLHINANGTGANGIIKVEGTEPDILFNDTDGGFTTFTFQDAGASQVAFGKNGSNDFYITRNASGWQDDSFVLQRSTGNIGIGTSNPQSNLQIGNNVGSGTSFDNFSDYQLLLYQSGTAQASYGLGIESGTFALNSGSVYDFKILGTDRMTLSSSGLNVVDRTTTTNFTMSNGAANGYLLQSDGSGNASWVDPTAFTNTDDQTAAEVTIADAGGNFTATNVEGALTELANATDETIYNTDGTLTSNRAVTTGNFDLNIDANTLVVDGSANRVGIGTAAPARALSLSAGNSLSLNGNNVTSNTTDGLYWHSGSSYGIFRSSGGWTAPDYQQLTLNWSTGIVLNPGTAYGKSYVDVLGGGLKTTSFTMSNGAANGYLLQSNANGDATWVDPTAFTNTDDQTAAEVTIADAGGNFTATNVEGALTELANATDENIYEGDGTLTGNRAVTTGNFDLNIDANTLVVDGSANRVGIGTNAPGQALDVVGNIELDNFLYMNGKLALQGSDNWLRLNQSSQFTSGIYSPSFFRVDNSVTFNEGGGNYDFRVEGDTDQNLLRVDGSADRIGIGTATPASKLAIGNNIAHDGAFDYSDAQMTIFDATNNGGNTPAASNDILHLVREGISGQAFGNKASFALSRYENNSTNSRTQLDIKLTEGAFNSHNEIMSLRSNGNVGIGTTTPDARLDVEGGTVRFSDYGNGTATGTETYLLGVDIDGDVVEVATTDLENNIYTNDGELGEDRVVTLDGNSLTFEGTRDIVFQADGDVGIGTTPSQTFDVNGVSLFRNGNNGNAYSKDQLQFSWNSGTQFRHSIKSRHNSSNGIGNSLDFYLWEQGINASTDVGTEHVMTLDGANNGSVGIGTTTPDAKLDVEGGSVRLTSYAGGTYDDNSPYRVLGLQADGDVISIDPSAVDNIYTTDGTLTGTREVSLGNSDIEFNSTGTGDFFVSDNGTVVFAVEDDNVGIGIDSPTKPLHIYEPVGTPASATNGTIFIEKGDGGGAQSIVFESASNTGSDYGYIQYSDDGSGNGTTSENSLLEIGVQNDVAGIYQDDIAIMPTGAVGIGTRSPDAFLDVEGGSVRFSNYGSGTYDNTSTATRILGVQPDGDVVEMNTATSSRIFYPPAVAIVADAVIAGQTLDLHQTYVDLFGGTDPSFVKSTSAPATIPTYAQGELYYYILNYDTDIFENVSVNDNGLMTYNVKAVATDNCSFINVVFVVK